VLWVVLSVQAAIARGSDVAIAPTQPNLKIPVFA
jgi:hypothetical protein